MRLIGESGGELSAPATPETGNKAVEEEEEESCWRCSNCFGRFTSKSLQKCPLPVSCTSMLSSWNVSSASQIVNPVPIDEVVIRKNKFGKESKPQVPT